MSNKQQFKVGDVVVIINNENNEKYYSVGCKGIIVESTGFGMGQWWVNFRDQGNREGTFRDDMDGVWAASDGKLALA